MNPLPNWFNAVFDDACRNGRAWRLTSVLGQLALHDLVGVGDVWVLNWPVSALTMQPTANPRYRIAVVRHDPSVDALLAALPAERLRDSTFRGRGAFPVRWWVPRGSDQLWVAQYTDAGHVVVRDADRVLIAVRQEDNAPRYVQRVLREVLIHGGRHDGFVLAHAAVVAGQGGAVLIVGDSGAGKTDLAVKLASHLRADLVTVDRCLLALRGERLVASGLPFGLNIHRGTLADLGRMTSDITQRFPPQHGKHYLNVDDFERVCGIMLTAQADVIGCLALRPASGAEQVASMAEDDLPDVLSRAIIAGEDPGFRLDWLGLGPVGHSCRPDLQEWAATLKGAGLWVSYRPGSTAALTTLSAWLTDRPGSGGQARDTASRPAEPRQWLGSGRWRFGQRAVAWPGETNGRR